MAQEAIAAYRRVRPVIPYGEGREEAGPMFPELAEAKFQPLFFVWRPPHFSMTTQASLGVVAATVTAARLRPRLDSCLSLFFAHIRSM